MPLNNGRLMDELLKKRGESAKSDALQLEPEATTAKNKDRINRNTYYYGDRMLTIIPVLEKLQKKEIQCLKAAENGEKKFENLSEALRSLEREVIYLRQEIINCTGNERGQNGEIIAFKSHIKAAVKDGVLELKIPCLLPRRNYFGQTKYIAVEMEEALSEIDLSGWDKDGKYYVVFVRIFGSNVEKRLLKDCDNVEEKFVIDALKGKIFADDDPYHVSLIRMTGTGDDRYTEIYVVPQAEIGNFLTKHQE